MRGCVDGEASRVEIARTSWGNGMGWIVEGSCFQQHQNIISFLALFNISLAFSCADTEGQTLNGRPSRSMLLVSVSR